MSEVGTRKRLLTGDRPTGALHLGHYVGTLKKRVELQYEYQCFFIVADLHMLTTKSGRDDIARVSETAPQLVLDALAAGIEPSGATFYLQSGIPSLGNLHTLLQSLVTVPRLQRIPSLKEMARDAEQTEMPFALLGYPVLQAADILSARAHAVPVGKDNAAHVEVTREIARRFNQMYGEVFPVPELIAGDVPTLPGIDGSAKMSKSLGNAIFLGDPPAVVKKKVMSMFTDPNRVRADVPGRVEGNPVFIYHDAFNHNIEEISDLKARYRAGTVGDVEVKVRLFEALEQTLEPMRERRSKFEKEKGLAEQLLIEGTRQMELITAETCEMVRDKMGLTGAGRRIQRRAGGVRW